MNKQLAMLDVEVIKGEFLRLSVVISLANTQDLGLNSKILGFGNS